MTRLLLGLAAVLLGACTELPTDPEPTNPRDPAFTGATGPIPTGPSELAFSNGTPTSVTLRWDDRSSFESSFEVRAGPGGRALATAPADQTSVLVSDLTGLGQYRFTVVAVSESGRTSEPSPEVVAVFPFTEAALSTSNPFVVADDGAFYVLNRSSTTVLTPGQSVRSIRSYQDVYPSDRDLVFGRRDDLVFDAIRGDVVGASFRLDASPVRLLSSTFGVSADGAVAVALTRAPVELLVWDTATGEIQGAPRPLDRPLSGGELRVLPDEGLVLHLGGDGAITALDLGTGATRWFHRGLRAAAYHAGRRQVLTSDVAGTAILLLDAVTGGEVRRRSVPVGTGAYRFSANGAAVSYGAGGRVGVAHTSSFELIRSVAAFAQTAETAIPLQGGTGVTVLASGGGIRTRTWDFRDRWQVR